MYIYHELAYVSGRGVPFRAFEWFNICIVLQIDQCRYFITAYNNTYVISLICTTIHTHLVDSIHVQVIHRYTYLADLDII